MIDVKWLDKFGVWVETNIHYELIDQNEIKELLRLARLGLWAEKHGIPDMRKCVFETEGFGQVHLHKPALSKLPKEAVGCTK